MITPLCTNQSSHVVIVLSSTKTLRLLSWLEGTLTCSYYLGGRRHQSHGRDNIDLGHITYHHSPK